MFLLVMFQVLLLFVWRACFFILLPYPKNDEIVSRETLSKDRAVFFYCMNEERVMITTMRKGVM